jgi:hypothetical protein
VETCLPLDRRFEGSNPAEAMDFEGRKNLQHTFLRREVKPSVQCRKILRHVKKSLRSMRQDTAKIKLIISFAKFLLICY